MRSTWVSIERSRARVSASMPPASSRASSRCASRSCAAAMRIRSALSTAGGRLGLRLREELDERAEPRLGLGGAGDVGLDRLAQGVDLLGGLADHRQHVRRGQRLLGLDAGDADRVIEDSHSSSSR